MFPLTHLRASINRPALKFLSYCMWTTVRFFSFTLLYIYITVHATPLDLHQNPLERIFGPFVPYGIYGFHLRCSKALRSLLLADPKKKKKEKKKVYVFLFIFFHSFLELNKREGEGYMHKHVMCMLPSSRKLWENMGR